ncbi:MAG: ATP-binding cassette domain-containing protein [Candidatus Electryonea clarkiae]|nr:ATP-binding cassette domain-containing protein [Candidatus Electryonea clarkiae]MDP8285933.1 ATP-binding cassette domain-containing protein [Candidatus Electryonea clarkiae]
MIELINISKIFARERGIENISLKVKKGEWVAIVGSAGAGKSTLLRHIYAAEKPDEGEIIVGDYRFSSLRRNKVPQLRRMLGIVDQDLSLMFDRSVFRNIAVVGEVLGWSKKRTRTKALRVLNQVGLYAHLEVLPATLSYGERRRLAIARALVADPFVLIADEPLGHLDSDNAKSIVNLLGRIHARGTTLLIATHRLELFEGQPVRVVRLESGRLVP